MSGYEGEPPASPVSTSSKSRSRSASRGLHPVGNKYNARRAPPVATRPRRGSAASVTTDGSFHSAAPVAAAQRPGSARTQTSERPGSARTHESSSGGDRPGTAKSTSSGFVDAPYQSSPRSPLSQSDVDPLARSSQRQGSSHSSQQAAEQAPRSRSRQPSSSSQEQVQEQRLLRQQQQAQMQQQQHELDQQQRPQARRQQSSSSQQSRNQHSVAQRMTEPAQAAATASTAATIGMAMLGGTGIVSQQQGSGAVRETAEADAESKAALNGIEMAEFARRQGESARGRRAAAPIDDERNGGNGGGYEVGTHLRQMRAKRYSQHREDASPTTLHEQLSGGDRKDPHRSSGSDSSQEDKRHNQYTDATQTPTGLPDGDASSTKGLRTPREKGAYAVDMDGRSQKSGNSSAPGPYKAGVKDLFRYATKWDHLWNFCGLAAACAAGAAQPLMTIVFGNLTTSFLNYTNALTIDPSTPGIAEIAAAAKEKLKSDVNADALLLVYIGIAMFGATYIYMATWMYTGEEITRRIREHYLAAVLRQEVAYFDIVGPGEITSRIQSDIQLIQEGISDKVPMSFMFLATFVTGFAVAFTKSWLLALVMSSIVPCIIAAGALMNVLATKHQGTELDYVASAATVAEEAMSTVRTAKAFGIETRLVDLYDLYNKPTTITGRSKAMISGFGMGVFFFIIYSSYALAFWEGSRLIASGTIATGVVMNVVFSILIGAFSMAMLAPNAQAWAYGLASAGKIFETIDRVPEIDSSSEEGARPARCDGEIEICNVDFRYPARRELPILESFSVQIPKGKVTALVGASGSGKSTIVSLVERFYDPDAGAVFLDGRDLRDLNIRWLRTQIGLVGQEPSLFATTIRENIGFGLLNTVYESAPEEKREWLIVNAAKQANAHSFIETLPEGYDTMVGERGFLLSGGQKQRIAIARAIVKNPPILLLDEATSALDTQSEGVVQEALDRASRGRTTITIAHRLSTIKNADNIVVMGKGRIIESGTHDGLLKSNGAYAGLVNAQKIRANTSTEQMYDDEEELADMRRRAAAQQISGLGRSKSRQSIQSITSLILRRKKEEQEGIEPRRYGLFYLLYRLAQINHDKIVKLYIPGFMGSVISGAVYPAFSILFGVSLQNFSKCANLPPGQSCPEPARSDMRSDANLNALYFFLISLVATVAITFQNHNLMLASSILMERLRRLSLLAYLRADVAFFDEDKNSSGALTGALSDNAQKINGLVGVTLGTIFQSLSTLVVGYAIGLVYGWKLALVCIAATPLTLSAGFVRLKLVVNKDAKIKKAHEAAAQRACEAAGAIRTVASLTGESHFHRVYREELKGPGKITHRAAFISTIFYSVSQALAFGVISMAFWYGSNQLLDNQISSGHFFTVLTSVIFGSIQAGNVFNFVPDISNARTAADDSIRLLDMRPEIDADSEEGIVLDHCEGHVKFENVHFRYPTRPGVRVLAGISLEIKPGTYCALVGGSGCGKSTTIQLIERFYDPVAGKVLIDGHDITELNLKSLRRHIAIVSQEPTLYDGTIAFNLKLGAYEDADKVTDQMMQRAAAQANILNFIESLPQGFETQVGGKGTQLSGGQKQRIAIARALIRNPKILLLDEATSALDSESEAVVQEALDKASRGRTTIAIAHRLSTVSRADRLFCLKDGVVAEFGDHRSLMALNGIYASLVSLQALEGSK